MSREGDMVDKTTTLKFMDQDVRKVQPVSELVGDPYSGVERIPKEGTHIISFVTFHNDRTRVSVCFEGFERFMTVKEQETDQDPNESEVVQKLTSYTMPQLNRKMWPKDVGGKGEVVGLKQFTDRKDYYRKRRLTTYCASEKR
jgi:hypothetical protein